MIKKIVVIVILCIVLSGVNAAGNIPPLSEVTKEEIRKYIDALHLKANDVSIVIIVNALKRETTELDELRRNWRISEFAKCWMFSNQNPLDNKTYTEWQQSDRLLRHELKSFGPKFIELQTLERDYLKQYYNQRYT